MLSKLTSLEVLNLLNNTFLSLSTSDNGMYYSFPQLGPVLFSSCSIRQFPNFFRTSKLKVLDLSNNMISVVCISKWEAEGWKELRVLNLSYNSLATLEQIPGKRLTIVDLHNKLTGNIPLCICNWISLTVRDLSKNSLSGIIPECIGNFSYSLEVMDLRMNNLYGKIPDFFVLILRSNRFQGSLPDSMESTNFSALRIVDLSGNETCGILPANLFRNLRAMTDVIKEILQPHWSTDLTVLHITPNARLLSQLHRPIPATFGNLVALESLDLSSNMLNGNIPCQTTKLTFPEVLNLSQNDLVGPIPHGNQFDTFDNDSYGGNLRLWFTIIQAVQQPWEGRTTRTVGGGTRGFSNTPFFGKLC
ncbi:receptor-like protein Cf-9 homolog [Hibiscus syriacus]|uniref:receptor-like protein Cf-9 homolog n=1 Tax=Hibiscus syriacus TaxID=106335 RepID=UPI001921FEA2|nr:receptor-like protein Cf-9 homolog [Hibiscus syriacus]